MTDDERELLRQLCGWVGAISTALSDGVGLQDLAHVHQHGMNAIGPYFERVFPPDSGISIRFQAMPDGGLKIGS